MKGGWRGGRGGLCLDQLLTITLEPLCAHPAYRRVLAGTYRGLARVCTLPGMSGDRGWRRRIVSCVAQDRVCGGAGVWRRWCVAAQVGGGAGVIEGVGGGSLWVRTACCRGYDCRPLVGEWNLTTHGYTVHGK